MAAAALAALLPLLLASSTPEVAAAAAKPNSTTTATMVDLLAAGAGDLTCPGGRYSCPSSTDLCVCDRAHRCVACLTHAASLNHGEVAAVGAIAQILEDKFVRRSIPRRAPAHCGLRPSPRAATNACALVRGVRTSTA